MRRLLTDNHEPRKKQLKLIREAIGIARSLLQAGVLERLPEAEPEGRRYDLTLDLPPDFALNQPLSTFALAAIDLLDPASDTYVVDVVSVIEATLDDPRQILAAQLNKAKGEAVAQMKAEGIEYDERMELLEEISYPMPLRDELEAALEIYRGGHPWVADEELTPKSVARDLSERAMTFVEYVGFYGLARSEGLLLRYLADARLAVTCLLLAYVPLFGRTAREQPFDTTIFLPAVAAYFVVARRRKAGLLVPPQHGGARSGVKSWQPLGGARAELDLILEHRPGAVHPPHERRDKVGH